MDSRSPLIGMARGAVPFVVLSLTMGACAREQVVQGECRPLYGADVCSWDRMSGNDLVAFGLTVPVAVADSAPAAAPMVWPPAVAATVPLAPNAKAAGFDNVTIYWEATGHPPGPYLVPHFDFHFNTLTTADLGAVDCADTTKPGQLPAGYELPDIDIPGLGMLVGLCVPHMGMHAAPTSELRSEAPFEKTMIVGYYAARPIFVEPMITRGALLARRSFPITIPQIPGAQANVRYPTHFEAEYDSTARAYRFVFSGFGARSEP